MFELVFYGELVADVSLDQAKTNVATLFKANAEQVDRMFSGQRVVIRNKLDGETAKKYILAMRKRGAVCQIERMGEPGKAVSTDDLAPDAMAPAEPAASPSPHTSSAQQESRPSVSNEGRSDNTGATAAANSTPSNNSGLPVAGERTDAVLTNTHFDLDPPGVRLSEEKKIEAPVFEHIDELTIAPVGSDLGQEDNTPPVSVPDTSHLSLKTD